MNKDLSMDLKWEAYKYLSQNELSDEDLDVYEYLTGEYLHMEEPLFFLERLDELITRATNEKVTAKESCIKQFLKSLYTKKEPL